MSAVFLKSSRDSLLGQLAPIRNIVLIWVRWRGGIMTRQRVIIRSLPALALEIYFRISSQKTSRQALDSRSECSASMLQLQGGDLCISPLDFSLRFEMSFVRSNIFRNGLASWIWPTWSISARWQRSSLVHCSIPGTRPQLAVAAAQEVRSPRWRVYEIEG